MKKSILMITLVMVFGLLCNTSLWAANGKGAGDGSMLEADLSLATEIAGVVSEAGITGSGLTIVDDAGNSTTVFGMGSASFWESLGVAKPAIGERVAVDAVNITFKDGSSRWIALNLTIFSDDGDEFVELRDANGTPAWRGVNKLKGCSGSGDCNNCPLLD